MSNSFRAQFRKHAGQGSRPWGEFGLRSTPLAPSTLEQPSTTLVQEGEADIDTYGNETRRLGGTKAAFQRPWHRDKRWWVRWPAQAWHVTGQRLIPRDQGSKYRPASHWWSRWLGKLWRMYRRSGGSTNDLVRPLLQSYLNLLLAFLPLALAATGLSWSPDLVFAFNFLAIIPLSGFVHLACEDLSANLSPTAGRLLVAFSDNLVELLVGIVALFKGEIRLVQRNMMGSVLCYSLLILGSCFIVHGVHFQEGFFNSFATKSITSLNLIALCSLLIPSIHHMVGMGRYMNEYDLMIFLSRAVSIILMLLYVAYLFFTLRTHTSLFDEDPESDEEEAIAEDFSDALRPISAIGWLAVSLTCVAFCTDNLLSSFHNSSLEANTFFLGFILFPFLGNLTDYVSACRVAWNNQLDITILVTIGSSMQIMLFTWPCLVILGWMFDKQMDFHQDIFEAAVLFLGVTVSSGLVSDVKSNYYVGAMCAALYAIMALAAYAHPGEDWLP